MDQQPDNAMPTSSGIAGDEPDETRVEMSDIGATDEATEAPATAQAEPAMAASTPHAPVATAPVERAAAAGGARNGEASVIDEAPGIAGVPEPSPTTDPARAPQPAEAPQPGEPTFERLNLSAPILRSLDQMGFDAPTPIQARAIPPLLAGRDVVAQALTGTGKTAAYGIPLVERIDYARAEPQAIVLVPTRELAVQVTEQLIRIGRHHEIRVTPIYGGQPYDRQIYTLRRGVHAIVATPGRLMDHMRRGTIDLSTIRTLILDEADQMLEMGFVDDVEFIISHLTAERTTALFSATMPRPILELARKHMRNPEMAMLSAPREMTSTDIKQSYYVVPFPRKHDALTRTLQAKRPERAIVFCATKRMVDEVVQGLQGRGYLAEGLHGDMAQRERERTLQSFRDGRLEALVATDVAARGIDIPEVTHVVNFDIPADPEYYVHRIGRTGRLGRTGEAITFVNPREQRALRIIERVTGAPIRREEVPSVAEAEERTAQMLEERLLDAIEGGGWRRYRPIIEELLGDHDAADVAAAALCLAAGRDRRLALPDPGERDIVAPPEPRPTIYRNFAPDSRVKRAGGRPGTRPRRNAERFGSPAQGQRFGGPPRDAPARPEQPRQASRPSEHDDRTGARPNDAHAQHGGPADADPAGDRRPWADRPASRGEAPAPPRAIGGDAPSAERPVRQAGDAAPWQAREGEWRPDRGSSGAPDAPPFRGGDAPRAASRAAPWRGPGQRGGFERGGPPREWSGQSEGPRRPPGPGEHNESWRNRDEDAGRGPDAAPWRARDAPSGGPDGGAQSPRQGRPPFSNARGEQAAPPRNDARRPTGGGTPTGDKKPRWRATEPSKGGQQPPGDTQMGFRDRQRLKKDLKKQQGGRKHK